MLALYGNGHNLFVTQRIHCPFQPKQSPIVCDRVCIYASMYVCTLDVSKSKECARPHELHSFNFQLLPSKGVYCTVGQPPRPHIIMPSCCALRPFSDTPPRTTCTGTLELTAR